MTGAPQTTGGSPVPSSDANPSSPGDGFASAGIPPRVSAIITTCDRPMEATDALASVLVQSRRPDEVIVVDDGTQAAFQLPEELAGEPAVWVIRTEGGRGACAARNAGAVSATGDVLMFLDDDDTWEPTKVAVQLAHFVDPEVVLVYTGRLIVGSGNRSLVKYRVAAHLSGNLTAELLRRNCIGTTSGAAIRSSAFVAVGGFDEQQPALQDYDLWIRLARVGRIVADREFNTRYTLAEGPSTSIGTGPVSRHMTAVERLQHKCAADYERLHWLDRRRCRANLAFSVAKCARARGWLDAVPHVARTLLLYPSPRFAMLLLPQVLRQAALRLVRT